MRFDDQLVVITGAASGIGKATAHAFAAGGARLALSDVDAARLDAVAAELGKAVVLARRVDVGDRAQMAAFADEVHALGPAADVVVNNAGVGQQGGVLDTSLDDWDWTLRVNLMGVVHGCHFFTPKMVERGRGHVVNLSSVLGLYAPPTSIAYTASKFAVLGLTLSMRGELAGTGVRATAICPGMIDTSIVADGRFAPGRDRFKEVVGRQFKKRGYPPAVVASAIVDAIGKDVAVRPVTREAWALYGLTRFAPRAVGDALGKAFTRSFNLGPVKRAG